MSAMNKKLCFSAMLKCSKVSCEVRKFMEIVERGTSRKDTHHVVPLAFCNLNLTSLSNKKQAIQRLVESKTRFMKVKIISSLWKMC